MLLIETFILALSVLVISILEFRASKYTRPANPEEYKKVYNQSAFNEEVLIKRIENTVKHELGGSGMDEFVRRLKEEKGIKSEELKGKGRSNSISHEPRDVE